MSYLNTRQIIFCEKDPEFVDFPIHLGGSSVLVSINGVMSLVTARHCIDNYSSRYNGSPKHCVAAIRNVGEQEFILFKEVIILKDATRHSESFKTEFDLAICCATPEDNIVSRDAMPLLKEGNWAIDEGLEPNNEVLIFGFPDLCGPHIDGKRIQYNPCCISVKVDRKYDDFFYRGTISEIEDRSGKPYPVSSILNGLSGSPVFRPMADGRECFSGIVVMGGSGYVYWLSSKYIAHFALGAFA